MSIIKFGRIKCIPLLIAAIIVSCSQPNPNQYIQYLDGYWEIEKVIMANGQEKQYTFNQSIDFIETKDTIGIRKKLQPQLDGSFIATNNAEQFTIKIENDSLRLFYTTPLATWKETIISAKENQMIVKNEEGNLYFYKTYEKLQL